MKDVKGFCKLMGINIPVYEHFDYYIDQYSKLDRWKNIKNLIRMYDEAEGKYGDLFSLRMKKSNEIIEFLKTTKAYERLINDNSVDVYPTSKNFNPVEGKKYLSIDIRKANWVAVSNYDFEKELGDSYDEFIQKFDVPDIFNQSKQLRQFIFGNINPKRQGRVQRSIIEELISNFSHLGLEVVCVKNDEVIYTFDSFEPVYEIAQKLDSDMFKIKPFTIKRVEDFIVNTRIGMLGDELYKEIIGCNGNMFFVNIKKYILGEPLDIRDLYFKMDGNLAIWNVENLKIEL